MVWFTRLDLPAASSISTELHCWSVKWKGKIDEARGIDTPLKALGTTDRDFFPNIRQIFLLHQPFLLQVQSVSDLSVDCDTYKDVLTEYNVGGVFKWLGTDVCPSRHPLFS